MKNLLNLIFFFRKKKIGDKKLKIANRPKCVLPKFRADRSHVRRVCRHWIRISENFCPYYSTSPLRTCVRTYVRTYVRMYIRNGDVQLYGQKFSLIRIRWRQTLRTWLRSARNFGKTRFGRFATFNFLSPKFFFPKKNRFWRFFIIFDRFWRS